MNTDIILPNVRFMFWISRPERAGAFVKLTLHPGQTISHGERIASDEGWTAMGFEITYEPWGTLKATVWHDGVGCDGRLSGSTEAQADIIHCTNDGQPVWCSPSYSQRDYSAQAEAGPSKPNRTEDIFHEWDSANAAMERAEHLEDAPMPLDTGGTWQQGLEAEEIRRFIDEVQRADSPMARFEERSGYVVCSICGRDHHVTVCPDILSE
ncbi:MAG: hypothetical protein IPF82_11650 [Blastocatellia bacterium]|nr:hypothetical protein [Blastocatellia bacterium]